MSEWSGLSFKEFKDRHQSEPVHLSADAIKARQNPILEKQRRREAEEFAYRNDAEYYIDAALNQLYREGGTRNTEDFLYNAMYYWRFKRWPEMWTGPFRNQGSVDRTFVNDEALEKLHIVYYQMIDTGVVESHELRITIHDYPGFKEVDGKRVWASDSLGPISFAGFCKTVKDRRYRTLWKKFLREKGETVHFEETPEGRSQNRGISEGHALMEMAGPGEDAVFASGYLPRGLQMILDETQRTYESEFPEIAYADLRLGKSASKIAQMVKSGELESVRKRAIQEGSPSLNISKAPRDRRGIGKIMLDFRQRSRMGVGRYVRDHQAWLLESGLLVSSQALNLDDSAILEREITRLIGGLAKAEKSGPNYSRNGQYKEPKLTREQTLGWAAYTVSGNASDAEMHYGEHGDFAATRSHDRATVG